MTFRAENFDQMRATFGDKAATEEQNGTVNGGGRWGRGRGRGRGGRGGRGRGGGRGNQDSGDISADIIKILRMVKQRQLEPVIIFSFARRYPILSE